MSIAIRIVTVIRFLIMPAAAFSASPHGRNACTSCHVEMTEVARHQKGEIAVEKVQCARCHAKVAAEHFTSVHMQNNISCAECHGNIHAITSWKSDKRKLVETCRQCHDKEASDFLRSSHGKSVMAGSQDSPSCADCHGLHDI